MLDATWAQLGGTIFLGMVGLWLAYNYRRQVRLKLADRQVEPIWPMENYCESRAYTHKST